MTNTQNEDAEFSAMRDIYKLLEGLDDAARERVVIYVTGRLEIVQPAAKKPEPDTGGGGGGGGDGAAENAALSQKQAEAPKYPTFADLFNAARPETNPRKALVAGYWFQVCQGNEGFDGFSANKELKNLGEKLANITNALDALKDQKPALAIQVKKSGSTQQARKVYKLTTPGIAAVEAMIKGPANG